MKKGLSLCVVLLLLFSISGCNKKQEPTTATNAEVVDATDFEDITGTISLVIIVGRHANAGMPTDSMLKDARGLIAKAFGEPQKNGESYISKAYISIIVSDGFPTDESELVTPYLTVKKNNEENMPKEIANNVNNIVNLLIDDRLIAKDENVDLLNALDKARVILSGKENPHILVLDTGITTTGVFDMTRYNIMDGDVKAVVDKVPQGQFPDLSGITIIFNGMGNLSSNPNNLQTLMLDSNYEAKMALKDTWIEILTVRCNATLYHNTIFEATPGVDQQYIEDGSGYPFVKVVAFQKPIPPDPNDWVIPEPPVSIEVILDASVLFERDKAKFIDPDNAATVLNKFAVDIMSFYSDTKNANEKIYVIGSIANTRQNIQSGTSDLSTQRAEVVVEELKRQLGKDYDKYFMFFGAGTTAFTWRNTNEFIDGEWSDSAAQNNRVVAIISSNSAKTTNATNAELLKPYLNN